MKNDCAERSLMGRLIIFYWVIRIFKPEWIIAYYIPSLGFIKGIPTLFILSILIGILIGNKRIRWEWGIGSFLIIAAISAVFSTNRGISIQIVRGLVETFILATATITYISTEKNIRKIFTIYLFAFIFFGIWGILGNGKIMAFMPLNNEDAFGPFMCMGISMNHFISLSEQKWKRKALWIGQNVCILGTAVSFARGTFLAFTGVIIYMLLRTRGKKGLILQMIVLGIIGISLISYFDPSFIKNYRAEVSSIWEEGIKEQTAKDRIYLWTKGLEMFWDKTFMGVGPGCYSFQLPRYTTQREAEEWGVNTQIFGRHIHNIFLQIMAEMGIFGIAGLLVILINFKVRTNSLIRVKRIRFSENKGNNNNYVEGAIRNYRFWGLALEGGMVGYLINSLFYNLLFFTWLWDLIILNAILFNFNKEFRRLLIREEPEFPEVYDNGNKLVN